MTREERAEHCRQIASKGGRSTVERHGIKHMSLIGKIGFRACLEQSGYSDAGHMIAHLTRKGRMSKRVGG